MSRYFVVGCAAGIFFSMVGAYAEPNGDEQWMEACFEGTTQLAPGLDPVAACECLAETGGDEKEALLTLEEGLDLNEIKAAVSDALRAALEECGY